jgi:hypothetical protein
VGAGALCGPTRRGDQRGFFAAFDHWRAPIPAPSIVSTPAPIQQPCSVSPQPLPLSHTHRPTVAWAGPRRSQGGGAHDADRQRESMSCEKQWVVANDKRWANQLGALRPRPPQMMVTPQPFSHSPVGAAGATVGAGALCGPTGRGDQRDFFAAFDHWRAPIPAPSIVSTPAPIQQPCSVSPQPLPLSRTRRQTVAWAGPRRSQGR